MKPGITIERDAHGIAHITAESRDDVYWGEGYAHATDRGLQMLLMRVLGQGRLCECLEDSTQSLGIDRFFRKMNWRCGAEAVVRDLPEDHRQKLAAYVEGINAAMRRKTPWEFKLAGYRPEPWTALDTVLLLRMMGYLTLSQSQAEIERFIVEMIQAGIDRERLEALFPGRLGGLEMDLVASVTLGERIVPAGSLWNLALPRMMASNNWVVSGTKTASGKPIVANDPHLETNRLPNVWYEVALVSRDRWITGASMPGIPGVLTGRTPDVAWGVTYAFMDTIDSWIERCRDGKYFRDGQWEPFTERRETIARKKHPAETVVFYENHHGVLDGDPHIEGNYLSTKWSGDSVGPRIFDVAFYIWDISRTAEALDLMGRVETDWSFVAADTGGDIGFQMSGLMPRRPDGVSGLVPLPGWDPANDWQGFVDAADLPRAFNPEEGFFTTTNQDLNAYGIAAPANAPMGPYRAERIASLLAGKTDLTVEDMCRMHYDVYSTQAERFMALLRPLLPDTEPGRILGDWDLCYDAESTGAFLFEAVYSALYREVFGVSGIGTAVIDFLAAETGLFVDFYLAFDTVLLSASSPWFGGRSREQVYRAALSSGLSADIRPWGETRQFTMTHIFFGGKLPGWLGFDYGPVTGIGNRATIHQGQIYRSADRATTFFASLRMVSDLAEACTHTNLAGGPSDRRFSRWYTTDIANWLTGKYKRLGPRVGAVSHPL
ncbi:MAG: penicillin acylase family protein [Pseudomonadota bacterium]